MKLCQYRIVVMLDRSPAFKSTSKLKFGIDVWSSEIISCSVFTWQVNYITPREQIIPLHAYYIHDLGSYLPTSFYVTFMTFVLWDAFHMPAETHLSHLRSLLPISCSFEAYMLNHPDASVGRPVHIPSTTITAIPSLLPAVTRQTPS